MQQEIATVDKSLERVKSELPRPKTKRLTVEVVRDVQGFSQLHHEWNELVNQSDVTIFQTFEWLFLWWKHFGVHPDRALHILVFRDQRTVVGIIPLFLESVDLFGFRFLKRLRFLGCGVTDRNSHSMFTRYGPSDFLDVIVHPLFQSPVIKEFVQYMQEHLHLYDEIELVDVPEKSIVWTELIPALLLDQIPYMVRRSDVCPRLSLPDSLDLYFRGLSSSVRRRFVQTQKSFSEDGRCRIETVSSNGVPQSAFRDLVILHQSRWNRLGYPGLFLDERFTRFQEEVLQAFWERGWIWFKTARIDGARVAARLGFRFKERLYDYLSGFDDSPIWSKHRPGLALLVNMVSDGIESGYKFVEFLRGEEKYKVDFTAECGFNTTVRILNPIRCGISCTTLRRLVEWYRLLVYHLNTERLLLHVQRREHGSPWFVFRYFVFRVNRLRQKL